MLKQYPCYTGFDTWNNTKSMHQYFAIKLYTFVYVVIKLYMLLYPEKSS